MIGLDEMEVGSPAEEVERYHAQRARDDAWVKTQTTALQDALVFFAYYGLQLTRVEALERTTPQQWEWRKVRVEAVNKYRREVDLAVRQLLQFIGNRSLCLFVHDKGAIEPADLELPPDFLLAPFARSLELAIPDSDLHIPCPGEAPAPEPRGTSRAKRQ